MGGDFRIYSKFNRILYKQTGDPDQTQRFTLSDLGMYCLPLSQKKDSRLIWVNTGPSWIYVMLSKSLDLACEIVKPTGMYILTNKEKLPIGFAYTSVII